MKITIRPYKQLDKEAFKQSIIDLQNLERAFDTDLLSGEETVDSWFNHISEENRQKDGQIYVAEINGKPAGFISVRVESKGEELITKPVKSVFVSDFIVFPEFRGKGVGKLLLIKADEYAKEKGILYIKISVFAANTNAREMYKSLGFKDHDITILKEIK